MMGDVVLCNAEFHGTCTILSWAAAKYSTRVYCAGRRMGRLITLSHSNNHRCLPINLTPLGNYLLAVGETLKCKSKSILDLELLIHSLYVAL